MSIDLISELNLELKKFIKENENLLLANFYNNSGGTILWLNDSLHLNERGLKVLNLMTNAENFGLFSKKYKNLDSIQNLSSFSKDTNLTSTFITFIIY